MFINLDFECIFLCVFPFFPNQLASVLPIANPPSHWLDYVIMNRVVSTPQNERASELGFASVMGFEVGYFCRV